ncbi:GspH/FimT family pseudopilin [Neisseria sp.]|uniref:GspH/FimT family pseudopilin n=1 Tax=Neisseria sp. TaxID=192066 RepID=UPI0028990C99|nr:GspH/FimT family pseudopilin [Neisseria sp.]
MSLPPHKPQGFTLVELLLVLAIAGIMAAIAYPTMSDWLAYRRVSAKSEQLINLLRLARAESVRLNLPVYVCPVDIADTGKPNNYCSTSGAEGYAAFADRNGDQKFDNGDLPLRAAILNTAGQANIEFSLRNTNTTALAFRPDGSFYRATSSGGTITTSRADSKIKITLTDKNGGDAKARRAVVLLLDNSGRVTSCARDQVRSTSGECAYATSTQTTP